jgi:hypothetical protein
MPKPTSHSILKLTPKKSGVYATTPEGKLDRVCDRISAASFINNEATGSYRVGLHFRALDGQRVQIEIDRSRFQSPVALEAVLLDAGFDLPPAPDRHALLAWLIASRPAKVVTLAQKPGWREGRKAFLTPDGLIGDTAQPVKLAHSAGPHLPKFKRSASGLNAWKREVATPALASSRLILLISAAFAAPLVPIMGQLSQGIHLYGAPGTGKSTAFVVAGSTYGVATEQELVKLSTTDIGLEQIALGHNNVFMLLDELGLLEGTAEQRADQIQRMAYKVPAGSAKVRDRHWQAQRGIGTGSYDLLFATNGEHALGELVANVGRKRSGGETSRLIDLAAAREGSYGIIDNLPKGLSHAEAQAHALDVVQKLKAACKLHYGHAFPAFVEKVVQHRKAMPTEIEVLMGDFLRKAETDSVAGAERRKADLFALLYAAGVLAIRWSIVPWTEKQLGRAIRRCYRDATGSAPNAVLDEGLQILREKLAGNTLIDLRRDSPQTRQEVESADGVIRSRLGHPLEACVKGDRFRQWFRSHLQADLVVAWLQKRQALEADPKRNLPTRQVRFPLLDVKLRAYVIRLADCQTALAQ